MPRNLNSSLMKPFVALAIPGMYLFYKYNQYKRQRQEQNRRKVTERELAHLNHKIDKLLAKLDEHEPELATSQEEECVICITARATMQTYPCGHRVVCRKCFVKTIQTAVAQQMLPLRCVICRAKILRLKQSGGAGAGGAGGLSPSPSSLSAFSACSSSFSLKSFRSTDSDASRASCKSAPPQILRQLGDPSTSSSSSSAAAVPSTSSSSSASSSSSSTFLLQPSTSRYKSTSCLAKLSSSKSTGNSGSNNSNNINNNINSNSSDSAKEKYLVKEMKSVSVTNNRSKSGRKLQSLPKVTVRSRSPHKLQLLHRPHRLEIIKEVE